jgi:hypothetical protein
MRKWIKRTLLSVAALTTMSAGLSYWLARDQPDWYRPRVLDAGEQESLARRAENALIGANNWADELKVEEARRNADSAATQATRPVNSHSVAFSEDELNALFQKWSRWNGWNERLAKYVTDPVVALHNGNLILAGKLNDLGTVASFHFKPEIDSNGKLTLKLARVLAGKLPMPKAVWTSQRDRMAGAIQVRLAGWQASARLTPNGEANHDAIAATMGSAMLDVLNDTPAEPIVFLQSMPLRVTDLGIVDDQLTLTVTPMSSAERSALMTRIGAAPAPATAPSFQ